MKKSKEIDAYIKSFPKEHQVILKKVRTLIHQVAPAAEEKISYGIPAFFQDGILIYFAGFKKHYSVYPAPRGNEKFKEELKSYKGGKGTVQFHYEAPVQEDLIKRILLFRMNENKALKSIKKK